LRDDSGVLHLRFLNFYGSQVKAMEAGKRLRVSGEARAGFFGAEMIHPRFREVAEGAPLPQALTPVYPATAGVGQGTLRRVIVAAIEGAKAEGRMVDTAPAEAAPDLIPFAQAIDALHFPAPGASQGRDPAAWRRVKFDELLAQQLSLKRAYRARRRERAPSLGHGAPDADAGASLEARLLASLPFALTNAQRRALSEIEADLAQWHPMRRLLQGDVGSGKTIVAALAACRAIDRGYQAAFMAPTEILAEQHFRKLDGWLSPLGVRIAWLAGSLKKRVKEESLAAVASGEARLAVGTHALFQDRVVFQRLGLAIIDEQHRFGVEQRLQLSRKGPETNDPAAALHPHQLMMSATPIPRTLAMTFYADLDVSVIDELPPGRTPVVTKLVADTRRDYKCICDASGAAGLLDTLVGRLAPGGEILLAGFYDQPLSFNFAPAFMREARIRIAAQWLESDLLAVRQLAESGRLSLDGLITHRGAPAEADAAYRTAFTDPACLKMILDWRKPS
jgi:ATP-dependent DNA helicase RecG